MTTETIEGTAVEVHEDRALVVADHGMTATGALALAALPDDEFDRRLAALEKGRDRVARIQKALMVKDVDYGVIPGTGAKPTLLKPGAEKLCQAYSLAADFAPIRTVADGLGAPNLSYLTRCDLHLGSLDGPVVAVGYGSANSWERKHRYRRGERVCPNCGKPAIIKGKEEYGGGWVCFRKKDGCGSKWPDGAPEIESQTVGDVENPDPFDLDVVLAKMSEKRAFIDATLRATAASGLFTQDIEDLSRPPDPDPARVDPVTGEVRPILRETPPDGLIGKAIAQGTADFELRQSPDGWNLPFRVKDGRGSFIVIAENELAQTIATLKPTILDQRVTVWGHWTDETIPKRGTKPEIKYQALRLARIQTPDGLLPAPHNAQAIEDIMAELPDDIAAAADLAFPEAETAPLGLVG